jgi:amidophosphoribosyltransferase
MAREGPVDADVVVPIPTPAPAPRSASGGIAPIRFGLIRNHYIGRTFIEPQQSIRHFGVKIKLNAVRSISKASASC